MSERGSQDRSRRPYGPAILTALALLALGCPATPPGAETSPGPTAPGEVVSEPEQQACGEPRPELCVQLYDPVCAQRDTGVRCVTTPCDSTEPREYPNGCEACRDAKVLSYAPGPC